MTAQELDEAVTKIDNQRRKGLITEAEFEAEYAALRAGFIATYLN